MVYKQVFYLLAALAFANAHGHDSPYGGEDECTCLPGDRDFEVYHIHVMFYPDLEGHEFSDNTKSSKYARALRAKFVEHFKVPDCIEGHPPAPDQLCAFVVDETGACGIRNAAPFVAPNFAFNIPVERYADTVPWMMANRGDLDFIVHPLSCGFKCSAQDHILWPMWAGNKWDVRFTLPEYGHDAEKELEHENSIWANVTNTNNTTQESANDVDE